MLKIPTKKQRQRDARANCPGKYAWGMAFLEKMKIWQIRTRGLCCCADTPRLVQSLNKASVKDSVMRGAWLTSIIDIYLWQGQNQGAEITLDSIAAVMLKTIWNYDQFGRRNGDGSEGHELREQSHSLSFLGGLKIPSNQGLKWLNRWWTLCDVPLTLRHYFSVKWRSLTHVIQVFCKEIRIQEDPRFDFGLVKKTDSGAWIRSIFDDFR